MTAEPISTVAVFCSLQNGMRLTVGGQSVDLKYGRNEVPAEFWTDWFDLNNLRNAVKSGQVRLVLNEAYPD